MLAKFNNINIIYSVFEILKEIKTEINMKFYSQKIEVKDVSTDKTMAFDFQILTDKLLDYNYEPSVSVIGLNTAYMCTVLKLVEKDNIMTFEINESMRNKLIIKTQNHQDHRDSRTELELIEPETSESKAIKFESGAYITMKADEFYKLISNIKVTCDLVKITCSEKTVGFQGMGQVINCKFDYTYENEEDDKGNGITIKMTDEDVPIVVGLYSIENILKFKKCTKIGTRIQFYIAQNSLLCLMHSVGDIGTFKAIITPVKDQKYDNQDEEDEINYSDDD